LNKSCPVFPDYEERLVKIKIDYKFNFLDIYLLSDYDLIITKFGRGYHGEIMKED